MRVRAEAISKVDAAPLGESYGHTALQTEGAVDLCDFKIEKEARMGEGNVLEST